MNFGETIASLQPNLESQLLLTELSFSSADLQKILSKLDLLDDHKEKLLNWLDDDDTRDMVSVCVQLAIVSWWQTQMAHASETLTWNGLLERFQQDLQSKESNLIRKNLTERLTKVIQQILEDDATL